MHGSDTRRHAGLDKIISGRSRLLSSVSGIALAAALATAGAAGAQAQIDPTFDRFVVVQPIRVCDDDGTNCSVVNTFDAGTAKALGQANVLPIFLPLSQFNDTALNASNNGPGDFNDGDGGSNDSDVINMWFTGPGSIVNCGGSPAIGCAFTPGRLAVIDAQALINEAVGNGNHPYHRTIAHEMGRVSRARRREYRWRSTVREMKEGPSRSAIMGRSQATASCCGQKPWW